MIAKITAVIVMYIVPSCEPGTMIKNNAGFMILLALLTIALLAAGCTGPGQHSGVNTTPAGSLLGTGAAMTLSPVTGDGQDPTTVAEANNRFASDLYSALAAKPDGTGNNLFFSPYSISSALALTAEGARGKTADEIFAVSHIPKNDTIRRSGFAAMNSVLNSAGSGYTLRVANALWAEKTHPFLSGYTDIGRQYYSANVTSLDFKSAPEASRLTINQWVEEKTDNRIKNLLTSGSITPVTRLVITNAVYFNGTWVWPFDAAKTQDAEFHPSSGTMLNARMMQNTDKTATYWYAETPDVQYIELPYVSGSGKSLSMNIILPKENDLKPAEAVLSGNNLTALQHAAGHRNVMVCFPKFKMETGYQLPGTLSGMGMPTAFLEGSADFSGMDGTTNLFISDVIHKAYINVNEVGTEAAAATAVVLNERAVARPENPPVFRADHPFIFLIQDKESGTILFMGRVENPAGS